MRNPYFCDICVTKLRISVFSLFSYIEVVRHVVKADGIIGLFGRGLKTRIMANALNVSINFKINTVKIL